MLEYMWKEFTVSFVWSVKSLGEVFEDGFICGEEINSGLDWVA